MVTTPTVLLTVMAHPDDAELWAGGTIARHVQGRRHRDHRRARSYDPIRATPRPPLAHTSSALTCTSSTTARPSPSAPLLPKPGRTSSSPTRPTTSTRTPPLCRSRPRGATRQSSSATGRPQRGSTTATATTTSTNTAGRSTYLRSSTSANIGALSSPPCERTPPNRSQTISGQWRKPRARCTDAGSVCVEPKHSGPFRSSVAFRPAPRSDIPEVPQQPFPPSAP